MGDALNILKQARNFDISAVKRHYQEEQELPPEIVEEHFEELLKYLSLCSATQKRYGMRGPIDECWHTFVIFTDVYSKFCEAISGTFIHHFPNAEVPECPRYSLTVEGNVEPKDNENVTQLRQGYLTFLKDYQVEYGEEAPAHLWPRPVSDEVEGYAGAACVCGCGCRCIA